MEAAQEDALRAQKTRLLQLERERESKVRGQAIEYYDPYQYQQDFHADHTKFRCLQAGNRIGKTHCGGAELAYHATGLYPDWWVGRRYKKAIRAVCGGKNNEKTRDIVQAALFGDPTDETAWGSGWIPKAAIGRSQRKPGVPDAKYHVLVKHVSGGYSKISLLAYDMGKETWMAHKADVNWLDEEPPEDIMSQAIRSIVDSGGIIYMTFTPENGTTGVVKTIQKQWSLHRAGWADVSGEDFDLPVADRLFKFETKYTMNGKPGHLTEEKIADAVTAMMPQEVKMRMEGIPLLGSGMVFPYPEEDISIDPFELPDHWPRIGGIDFGYTHATAVVYITRDPETDIIYLYDGFKVHKREINEIVPFINARPSADVLIAWPHDGNKNFGMGGSIQKQFKDFGINLMDDHFTNPPKDDQKEGQGGIQIMPGIVEMATRFNAKKLRVFSTLGDWFEELRNYHYQDNKIVDKDDDYMAATRYAVQSIRHAETVLHKFRMPNVKGAIR